MSSRDTGPERKDNKNEHTASGERKHANGHAVTAGDAADSLRQGSRRQLLRALGSAAILGVAGCQSDSTKPDTGTATRTRTASETGDESDGIPTRAQAIEEWGPRINDICRQAEIDWRQFEGDSIVMGMNVHPFTETTGHLLSYFEELTGINVVYNSFPEEELWKRISRDMENQSGQFDGLFLGLWPGAGYHSNGWTTDLTTFLDDSSLTDRDWLHLEDFPKAALESYTYLGSMDGAGELVALPIGLEVYGCVGYDRPTFEQLGLSEPTTFEELLTAAQTIHESDEVDRAGVVSRASEATLSTANWATMFKSHGAEWIDYDAREPMLDSERGVASLETYATLMGEYGPENIENFNWYRAHQAFSNGDVGIIYATPNAAGLFTEQQYERTEWLPPLEGPEGDRVASAWQWGLGISEFSRNPGATWLFIQWATSRPMNFLVSTQQWRGQSTYGHARTGYIFDQDEYDSVGQKASWVDAFTEATGLVPRSPPPVPFHTPQNMDLMSHAATAMNGAVVGEVTPKATLSEAADAMTPLLEAIPDEYIQ